jgi:glutamyl-tRNA reductase
VKTASVEEFQKVGFVYKNQDHKSYVSCRNGLDSQILGDFEIISQIRTSFSQSKSLGLASNFMERLVNAVIQASKKNKTDTEISSGALRSLLLLFNI